MESGLRDEIVKVKGVIMHHDSAGISDNFTNEPSDHADHEPPSLVFDTEPELPNQKQAESSSIDDIAGNGGQILHRSTAKRTCFHGAVVGV